MSEVNSVQRAAAPGFNPGAPPVYKPERTGARIQPSARDAFRPGNTPPANAMKTAIQPMSHPQFVTPLFRGIHYQNPEMEEKYSCPVGTPLWSPATFGAAAPFSAAVVKSWEDLDKITDVKQFPITLQRHHRKGRSLYRTLVNLYVNSYSEYQTVMPEVLRAFPGLSTSDIPFISMSERPAISHGYAQHEGKKDKSGVNDLGGVLHGLGVPISFQQSQPLWTNIPARHATGDLTIKVRHLPQAEHVGFAQVPGEYHLKSWEVDRGETEKEMEKTARSEGEERRRSLVEEIEKRGDIVAYPRRSISTGALHLFFDDPPYTTDLERKQGSGVYANVYRKKIALQKTLRENIQEMLELDQRYEGAKKGSTQEQNYFWKGIDKAIAIEKLYSRYKRLCVQLTQFEGQELFPLKIGRQQRYHPYEGSKPLHSPEELEQIQRYHNPDKRILLDGPMKEIKSLLKQYFALRETYLTDIVD